MGLEIEVSRLQGQMNDKETMCRYCANKLGVHIGIMYFLVVDSHMSSIFINSHACYEVRNTISVSVLSRDSDIELTFTCICTK